MPQRARPLQRCSRYAAAMQPDNVAVQPRCGAMRPGNAATSPWGKTMPRHRHGKNRILCALLPMANVPLSLFCGVLPGLGCVFQTFAAFFPKSASERAHFGKNRAFCRWGIFLAEAVGFEPTEPLGSTVFKTAAFDHSATPPHAWAFRVCRRSSRCFPRRGNVCIAIARTAKTPLQDTI